MNTELMGSVTPVNHGQRLLGGTHPLSQALWLQLLTQTAALSPQRSFLPYGSWSMGSRHPGGPGPQTVQREPEWLVPAEAELGAVEGGQPAHSGMVEARLRACSPQEL